MKQLEISYQGFLLKVNSNEWDTQIVDSYKVKKRKDMKAILALIKAKIPMTDAINRLNVNSMIREWRAHNLLYALGIARSHTKDVDLNENPWYIRVAYFMLSLMYWKL